MPRHRFQWGAVPQPLLRRLALDLELPGEPARALEEAYGRRPKAGFVRAAWPTLRDAWLARDAAARRAVVAELRAAGLGDTGLPVRTRPQQLAYLASCRNDADLRAYVLAAFHVLGGMPPEREPEPEPGPAREADGFEAGLDAAWVEFAGLLEVALRGLGEGFVAIDLPEVGGEIPTMVFVGVDGGVRATLGAGDDDLPLGAVVADAQRPVLRALGWGIGPKGLFASLNPRRTPAAIAATAVVTAREVFGVVHPSFLTTANFGPDDGPEPEVDGEGVTADVRGPAHLAALVDAALAQRLPGRPERDRDGDVVLDLGRATGYVRVAPDCAYVSVFTPLLYDVPGDALVLERLNQLNKSWRMVRFTWAGGIVTATLDLWCSPFVPELLRNGLDGMAAVVAELPDLQLRLGGRAYGWVDEE